MEREFYSDWIEDTGKLRYMQELSKRVTAENINEAFPRELSKAKNAIDKFDKLLTELRSQYNHDFRMGYDVNSCDNAEFDNALKEINEMNFQIILHVLMIQRKGNGRISRRFSQ